MGNQKRTIRNKRKIGVSKFQDKEIDLQNNKVQVSKQVSRDLKFTIISIFIVVIALISTSFAIFSSIQKSKNFNTITVGTLKIDFTDTEDGMGNIINLNDAFPESDTDGLNSNPYTFKISNSGTLNANYTIKILDDDDMINEDNCRDNLLDKSKIRVSVNGNTPFTLSDKELNGYAIESNVLSASKSSKYSIRIWIDENAGNEVLGKHYHGKIVIEGQNSGMNKNIKTVYNYDEVNAETKCITGEEVTCQETKCYQNKVTNSCPTGTIVKYAVNDSEEKYFYVLHDDGSSMTLQQRENTIRNVAWYGESNDNTKGPLTILPQLESTTAGWNNVNNQTYAMGTTNFNNTNAFTGCSAYNSCATNTYILPERTSKARMITEQEVSAAGCTLTSGSCPDWMHNYLYQSTSNGGSIDDNTQNASSNFGYWTMSAYSPISSNSWCVNRFGSTSSDYTNNVDFGARAVVEISK